MEDKDLENKYEEKHVKNLVAISVQVKILYNAMVQHFSQMATRYNYSDSSLQRTKTWFNNASLKKEIDAYLKKFSGDLEALLRKQFEIAWTLAENKQDALFVKILKATGIVSAGIGLYKLFNRVMPIITPVKGASLTVTALKSFDEVLSAPRRLEAMNAFINRSVKGLKLSERVWKLADGNLKMIEELLSNGILEGKSAAEISITLNQYLNDPSVLFRRVRNKLTGELEMSGSAKAYHPGRGVYRSSRQNAMRLAVTETNMAYHTADHNRRQLNPCIVGYEVKLSGQHPAYDVCDSLKGRYPKDFLFTSWHPMCRCRTTEIMLSDEEFVKYQQSILNGTDSTFDFKSVNKVNQVPDGFNNWIDTNKDRAKEWASLPYFLQDNPTYCPTLKDLL